jgi:ubiquinol-cytochrome c reductase subunit 9
MAGIARKAYNTLFRRTSTFAATIMLGAFFFERTFDVTSEYIFDSINHGVRLLWDCVSNDSKWNFLTLFIIIIINIIIIIYRSYGSTSNTTMNEVWHRNGPRLPNNIVRIEI